MTQKFLLEEINLQLRSAYRKEFHKFQTLGEKSCCYKIKHELLRNESNQSKKFYRYRNFVGLGWHDSRLNSEIEDITADKITFVSASIFNDPYDCRLPIPLIKKAMLKDLSKKFPHQGEDELLENELLIRNFYEKKRAEVENRIKEIRDKIPVISFATRPDDMYFWSHYGGVHKGYCLEYEFGDDVFNNFMHPVEYVENWPEDFDELTNGKNGAIALIKSMDWVKEREWRMVGADNPGLRESIKIDRPSDIKISAIYLGLDFFKEPKLESKRIKLLTACDGKDIFQAKLKDDGFGIKFSHLAPPN